MYYDTSHGRWIIQVSHQRRTLRLQDQDVMTCSWRQMCLCKLTCITCTWFSSLETFTYWCWVISQHCQGAQQSIDIVKCSGDSLAYQRCKRHFEHFYQGTDCSKLVQLIQHLEKQVGVQRVKSKTCIRIISVRNI